MLTVLGIAAVVLFNVSMRRHTEAHQAAALRDDLAAMRKAIRQYRVAHGHYPASLNDMVQDELRKIPFDPKSPDLETVRQIVLERLRRDTAWQQLDNSGDGFAPFVEYVAPTEFEQRNGRLLLLFLAQEVFWQFVVEGILARPNVSCDQSTRRNRKNRQQ